MGRIAICVQQKQVRQDLYEEVNSFIISMEKQWGIDCYPRGMELLQSQYHYDLIFLGEKIYTMNGIKIAETIRQSDTKTLFIMITERQQIDIDDILIHPFAYLKTPIAKGQVSTLLKEIQRYEQEETYKHFIPIKVGIQRLKFDIDDIMYFEAMQRYVIVHTVNGEYRCCETISDLAKKLEDCSFYSPHRAYLVHMKYVLGIQMDDLVLMDQAHTKIPISRLHRKTIIEQFMGK